MKILINNEPFELQEKPQSMGDFFRELAQDERFVDGHVSQIFLNGNEIEIPDAEDPFPLGEQHSEMRVVIESWAEILERSLRDGLDMLKLIKRGSDQCVEGLRGGNVEQANQTLVHLIDNVSLFLSYLDEINKFVRSSYPDVEIVREIGKLNEQVLVIVKQIVESQENHDVVLLADLLEFEMGDILEQWAQMMQGPLMDIARKPE